MPPEARGCPPAGREVRGIAMDAAAYASRLWVLRRPTGEQSFGRRSGFVPPEAALGAAAVIAAQVVAAGGTPVVRPQVGIVECPAARTGSCGAFDPYVEAAGADDQAAARYDGPAQGDLGEIEDSEQHHQQ